VRKVELDEWVAVAQFRYTLEAGRTTLEQLWITMSGKQEWRPVPIIEVNDKRKPAIAGYLEDDD
jgi:hypothetical protein